MAQESTFKVTNVGKRLHMIGGQRIIPGAVAEISTKHHAAFKKAFGHAGAELIEGDGRKHLPPPAKNLVGLAKKSISEAVEMVKSENDVAQLGAWLEGEDRKEVLAAIQAKLEKK
jgi:hypothetical protein